MVKMELLDNKHVQVMEKGEALVILKHEELTILYI
jgi:hypothetical protein